MSHHPGTTETVHPEWKKNIRYPYSFEQRHSLRPFLTVEVFVFEDRSSDTNTNKWFCPSLQLCDFHWADCLPVPSVYEYETQLIDYLQSTNVDLPFLTVEVFVFVLRSTYTNTCSTVLTVCIFVCT